VNRDSTTKVFAGCEVPRPGEDQERRSCLRQRLAGVGSKEEFEGAAQIAQETTAAQPLSSLREFIGSPALGPAP